MKVRNLNFGILDEMLISSTNFAISLLLARMMPANQFGLYIFASTTLVLCTGLLNSAVCNPLAVLAAPLEGKEWEKYLAGSMFFFLSLSVILSLFFFSLSFVLSKTRYMENGEMLGCIGVILLAYLGQELVRKILITKMKTKEALFVDALTYGFRLVLVFTSAICARATPNMVLLIFGISSFTGILYGIGRNFRFFCSLQMRVDRRTMSRMWSYGKWTFAEWIPFVLSGKFYVYVVTVVLGNAANGILGACQNLIAPLRVMLGGITNIGLPYYTIVFKEQGDKALAGSLKKLFSVLSALVLIYVMTISFFSSEVLAVLFGKYEEHGFLVALFGAAMFMIYLAAPLGLFLKVSLQPRLVFFARLFTALVNMVACIALINKLELNGAAYSYILSQGTMFIFLCYFVFRAKRQSEGRPSFAMNRGLRYKRPAEDLATRRVQRSVESKREIFCPSDID
jgi:O-antigen/teichoic acid export membrane protein